ncbi:DUF1501 domain-containing protein [Paludisphaera rhizosphaerae]|uniref:DUF1501 domain-containing protein n=1 Tax=Paludisphaera rhizosphaerae TaxID=2711216 RepID=UPI001F110D13|nr:DUF1501 domain-containing protein [Paludisphaera rhizosphaerae]
MILLMLVGGPSQLETWDPKPDAPLEVRGPFDSIATSIPGVRISEHLPRLASRMDKIALIRSMNHDEAPIHETGLQLLQTGRVSREDDQAHFGAAAAKLLGGVPGFVVTPGPIRNTGVQLPKGQTAGDLGVEFGPKFLDPDRLDILAADSALDLSREPEEVRESYGATPFGRRCLAARRMVEAGVRVVTVNMYDTVFDAVSWDCHGTRPFSTFEDYRQVVLPTFDRAFSGLLDDLEARGLLSTTLVAAVGEFGRTPRINTSGGRDHWPGVWSAAMAGGGVRGGQVVGASDGRASAPVDRPVSPLEWLATVHQVLGLQTSSIGDVVPAAAIHELFS